MSSPIQREAAKAGETIDSANSSFLNSKTEADSEAYDLHPIELTVHTLLNGPLDSLNEGFEQLGQSQLVLLTRLKHMERRLNNFKKFLETDSISSEDIKETYEKIAELNRRLKGSVKTLNKADQRLKKVEDQLTNSTE